MSESAPPPPADAERVGDLQKLSDRHWNYVKWLHAIQDVQDELKRPIPSPGEVLEALLRFKELHGVFYRTVYVDLGMEGVTFEEVYGCLSMLVAGQADRLNSRGRQLLESLFPGDLAFLRNVYDPAEPEDEFASWKIFTIGASQPCTLDGRKHPNAHAAVHDLGGEIGTIARTCIDEWKARREELFSANSWRRSVTADPLKPPNEKLQAAAMAFFREQLSWLVDVDLGGLEGEMEHEYEHTLLQLEADLEPLPAPQAESKDSAHDPKPSPEALQTPQNSANEGRDRWIYEQRLAGWPWKRICIHLKRLAGGQGWEPLERESSCRSAHDRFLERHPELPRPERGKPGRPASKK